MPIDETWNCLAADDQIAYDAVIDLGSNRGWRENIQAGRDYWLQYGSSDHVTVPTTSLTMWRFGTFEVSQQDKQI